ncbi:hypothetical protein ABEB36_010418 [Hypothenemus hampei]|uniref:Transposase n=1 Tax=Hypothenemus hampei TaxID=57062 RepID=A0ABD1EJM5_HYPHA
MVVLLACFNAMSMPPRHPRMVEDDCRWRRRQGHRFQVCPNCRTVSNRDVNAARGIWSWLPQVQNYQIAQPTTKHVRRPAFNTLSAIA